MARRKPSKKPIDTTKKGRIPENTQPLSLVQFLVFGTYLVAIVSLANVASQLSLHPIYGGIIVSKHFQTLSLAVCLIASLVPWSLSLTRAGWAIMSLLVPMSPKILHRMGIWTASWNNPTWGPIVSQLGTAIPFQALAVYTLGSNLVSQLN